MTTQPPEPSSEAAAPSEDAEVEAPPEQPQPEGAPPPPPMPDAEPPPPPGISPAMTEEQIRGAGLAVDLPWEGPSLRPPLLRYGTVQAPQSAPGAAPPTVNPDDESA